MEYDIRSSFRFKVKIAESSAARGDRKERGVDDMGWTGRMKRSDAMVRADAKMPSMYAYGKPAGIESGGFFPVPLGARGMTVMTENREADRSLDRRLRGVLVVCDAIPGRGGFWRLLRRAGFEVAYASDGRKGLEAFLAEKPGLVFADLEMTGMDGLVFIETIARESPMTAIVALSRTSRGDRAKEALRRGAGSLLSNPLRSPVRIGMCIERARARAASRARREAQASADEATRKPGEHRYRQLLRAVSGYVYRALVREGQLKYTAHGRECLEVTGFSYAEYARDPGLWERMILPEDRGRAEAAVLGLSLPSKPVATSFRIRHRDGSIRWIEETLVPSYDERGGLVAYDGVVVDITDRMAALDAARESERLFRDLVAVDPDMTALVDAKGRLLAANARFVSLIGLLCSGMEIRTGECLPFERLPPSLRGSLLSCLARSFSGEQCAEKASADLIGSERCFEIVVIPLRSGRGEIDRVGVSITDRTERERAERALKAALEAKDLFLREMRHPDQQPSSDAPGHDRTSALPNRRSRPRLEPRDHRPPPSLGRSRPPGPERFGE
jgi:PAS domain S-box-containing protein